MITERDEIRAKTSLDMIDSSSLELKTKAELKESIEEAKANLNGRTLEERVLSIAQSQFDQTRLLAGIIIQFKDVADKVGQKSAEVKRSWKDVIVETKWPCVVLGGVVAVCAIFQPQIVELLKAVCQIVR